MKSVLKFKDKTEFSSRGVLKLQVKGKEDVGLNGAAHLHQVIHVDDATLTFWLAPCVCVCVRARARACMCYFAG